MFRSRGLPSPEDEREADTKLSEVLAFLAQKGTIYSLKLQTWLMPL